MLALKPPRAAYKICCPPVSVSHQTLSLRVGSGHETSFEQLESSQHSCWECCHIHGNGPLYIMHTPILARYTEFCRLLQHIDGQMNRHSKWLNAHMVHGSLLIDSQVGPVLLALSVCQEAPEIRIPPYYIQLYLVYAPTVFPIEQHD